MITREELIKKVAQQLVDADNAFFFEPQGRKKTVVAPSDVNKARLVIRVALEAAAEVVRAEAIEEPQDDSDDAYNLAITHATSAIRSLIRENDND